MDAQLARWQYESSLEFAIKASADPDYSDATQRVFALYAMALKDCYQLDRDDFGRPIARLKEAV